MTIRLNANIVAMRTQFALNRNDRMLGTSIERLSSGIRIQSAKDDAAGLTIANQMRHQLMGVEKAVNNVEDGVSMMQTAEGGMDQIAGVLLKARQLAVQAANEGVNDEAQLIALQEELDNIVASVTNIASRTEFAGKKVISGGLSTNTLSAGTIDPADNAKATYEALTHDLRFLPGGIEEHSTIRIDPPSSSMYHDRLTVRFTGAPTADTPLNGLVQQTKTGAAVTNTGLVVNGSEQVTINGPLGSRTLTLQNTTTINDFVQMVNAFTGWTGTIASYDDSTGQLALQSTAFGTGALSVHSQDLSGGGGIGLFDVDTTDPVAKQMASDPNVMQVDLNDRTTGLAATGATQIADLVGNNTAPAFTAALNDIDGKHITIFGPQGHDTMTFEATSLDDILEIINDNGALAQGTVSYDSGTSTLTVTDTGVPTTVNTVLTPQDTLRDVLTLIDTTLTSSADLAINPAAGTIAITDAGQAVADLTLESPTVQDVLDFVNSRTTVVGAEARLVNGRLEVRGVGGPVQVSSDDMTRNGLSLGLLDLATADINDNGGLTLSNPTFAMALSDRDRIPDPADTLAGLEANGVVLDNAVGQGITLNDGINPATVIAIGAATTIDDIVTTINNATLLARADYHEGSLRITGIGGGNLTVTADDMTTNINTDFGLFDADTTSADNGAGAIDTRPTTEVHYVDAEGTERTVLLQQVTTADGGRSFTNLTGGPAPIYTDMAGWDQARFDGFEPGAFTLTMREPNGVHAGFIYEPENTMTATRTSITKIQTGGTTGDHVVVDIRDMRAAALGHDSEMILAGFRSLQDLSDRKAFINGFADEAIQVIDAAIDEVSSQRGDTGAMQADILEPTLSYLGVSIENMTGAESRIRDVDFAKESAEFAKMNIKVQAATAMLAQANQVPQSVLQLLQ